MRFIIMDEIRNFYQTNDSKTYPNAILLHRKDLDNIYPKLSIYDIEDSMEAKLQNYYGLKVIFTETPIEPRLLKL